MRYPCPSGLTYMAIEGQSKGGRLQHTAPCIVQSLTVDPPVPPKTKFNVRAIICGSVGDDYAVKFDIGENATVTGARCACEDQRRNGNLCKHILRVLLEMADLDVPEPASPAIGRPLGGAGLTRKSPRVTPTSPVAGAARAAGAGGDAGAGAGGGGGGGVAGLPAVERLAQYPLGNETEIFITAAEAQSFLNFELHEFQNMPFANTIVSILTSKLEELGGVFHTAQLTVKNKYFIKGSARATGSSGKVGRCKLTTS